MEKDLAKDMEKDLYDLFGVEPYAETQTIKKAYRKKALTCHPDKNPDDPRAAELFLQLSRALEILINEETRNKYDKLHKGRKAAHARTAQLDSVRKRFKEDLERREEEARKTSHEIGRKTKNLAAEIERLRKEGSSQLQEEMAFLTKLTKEQTEIDINFLKATNTSTTNRQFTGSNVIKLRWKSDKNDETNGGYNAEVLKKIFSKYGDVEDVVVSDKKGRGLLHFTTADAAEKALLLEKGLTGNYLTVSSLVKNQPRPQNIYPPPVHKGVSRAQQKAAEIDFEAAVLNRLLNMEKDKSSNNSSQDVNFI